MAETEGQAPDGTGNERSENRLNPSHAGQADTRREDKTQRLGPLATFHQLWQNLYIRAAIYLLGLYLAYELLSRTRAVWVSFLLAYTLAYLAHPLVSWLERRGLPRWGGVALTVFTLLLLLGGISFLASQVVTELSLLAQNLPEVVRFIETLPARLGRALPESLSDLIARNLGAVNTLLETAGQTVIAWLETNSQWLLQGVASLVGGVFQLGVVLILTTYLLYRFPQFTKSFIRVFPPRNQAFAQDMSRNVDTVVGSYLRAQVLIALSVGTSIWLGLVLLGVPLAAVLGVIAGIFNLVPLLGPIIAGVPALLLALTQGWLTALGTLLLFVAINQLDGNVVSPWVFSQTTRVHPVTVIVAIATGLTLFGLWGAFLAVPVAALLKLFYRDYYQQSRWYRRRQSSLPDA